VAQQQVLIVEDDDLILQLLRRTLDQAGYAVTAVQDGHAAMRAIDQGRFDFIITDIVMPGADGLETILYVRRKQPEAKIVAMTGGANQLFLDNARGLGADLILAKPFKPTEMLAALQTCSVANAATTSEEQ
jgi:two-component system cell cycle response regulator CpdR